MSTILCFFSLFMLCFMFVGYARSLYEQVCKLILRDKPHIIVYESSLFDWFIDAIGLFVFISLIIYIIKYI